MEEKLYKQKGLNKKYPEVIRIWKLDETVPEWLSDIAKVSWIDNGTGSVVLETIRTSSGGYSIIGADGNSSLVTVNKIDDYVCIGDDKIFPLNKDQLRLLYRESEAKKKVKLFNWKWFRRAKKDLS